MTSLSILYIALMCIPVAIFLVYDRITHKRLSRIYSEEYDLLQVRSRRGAVLLYAFCWLLFIGGIGCYYLECVSGMPLGRGLKWRLSFAALGIIVTTAMFYDIYNRCRFFLKNNNKKNR